MSVAAKTRPTIRVKIQVGSSRAKLYVVPRRAVKEIITVAHNAAADDADQWMTLESVFPTINDPVRGPAAALRGFRYRDKLTQVQLAERLKVSQTDLSKMEKGKRAISKNMARKLAKIFRTDYRVFL